MSLKTLRPPRWLYELAAIAIAGSIVYFLLRYLSQSHGYVMVGGHPIFGDFIGFWSAGRATIDGHLAQIYDERLIYQYHKIAAPDVRFVAHWSAPPTFLLLMVPLALLPFPAAAITWMALGLAIYFYAARQLLPDRRALIFAATAPAAVYHLGTVQTGLAVAGLSGLALHWLDKRPRLAGALVGLLAIKPHLALLWPILLLITRRWQAFIAAAISTLIFIGVSVLAFGADTYVRFFEHLAPMQSLITNQRITTPAYGSLYANLLSLHVPLNIAATAHAISAVAAVLAACWLFWRRRDLAIQGAALCAATLLASPYMFFYDYTLLLVGAALLRTPRSRFETVALIFGWGAGLSLAFGYVQPVPLCPLAAWLVLIAAIRRTESADVHPAPAQPR